jgi:hypothetical protein
MIVWGGQGQSMRLNTGAQYDPVGNTWTATITSGAPPARASHSAVWTGSKMIVWGGQDNPGAMVNSGGLYDPSSDSWSATSLSGAPAARWEHSAFWTGLRMIVWGGSEGNSPLFNTGGQHTVLFLYVKN